MTDYSYLQAELQTLVTTTNDLERSCNSTLSSLRRSISNGQDAQKTIQTVSSRGRDQQNNLSLRQQENISRTADTTKRFDNFTPKISEVRALMHDIAGRFQHAESIEAELFSANTKTLSREDIDREFYEATKRIIAKIKSGTKVNLPIEGKLLDVSGPEATFEETLIALDFQEK